MLKRDFGHSPESIFSKDLKAVQRLPVFQLEIASSPLIKRVMALTRGGCWVAWKLRKEASDELWKDFSTNENDTFQICKLKSGDCFLPTLTGMAGCSGEALGRL